jgi:hypothetical protein
MKKFLLSISVMGSMLFASSADKTLHKIIPDKNTVLVNQNYVDNLSKGWNLIGVEHNITDLSILKNVDIAWIYDNKSKQWRVFSNMNDIKNVIANTKYSDKFLTSIPAGSGIWVYRKIDLPKIEKFDYEIIDKNDKEAKVRLKINVLYPKNNNLFYVNKFYDNGKEKNLSMLPPTMLPPLDNYYSIADINLTGGYHKLTLCEGVGLLNTSSVRYNVCKSIDLSIDLSPIDNVWYEFKGSVVDENNQSLDNVEIILQLADKNITSVCDNNGNYELDIDKNISFPVLLTAVKEGYMPASKNVYKENNDTVYNIDFQLQKKSDNVVVIDKSLHHLGDDSYSGTINSQFQVKSEGTVYTKKFNLTQDFLNSAYNVKLTLYVKGAQYTNEVYLNGKFIDYLDRSPSDGSFGYYEINVPVNDLKTENVLEIKSKYYNNDYDDFEFANIQLKAE